MVLNSPSGPCSRAVFGLVLVLLGLPGCEKADDTDLDPNDPWNLCVLQEDDNAVFGAIEASLSEIIPTVVTVEWASTQGEAPGVIFRMNSGETQKAPVELSVLDEPSTLLLGLKQEADVSFRVVTTVDDELWCSETQEITTGTLRANLPKLTVENFSDTGGGYTLFTFVGWERKAETIQAVVIVDQDGDYVWAVETWNGAIRARMSESEHAIYTLDPTMDPAKQNIVKRFSFDGSEQELQGTGLEGTMPVGGPNGDVVPVGDDALFRDFPGAHSDLVDLGNGTLASFGWDVREYEDGERTLVGETIIERDSEGKVTEIWTLFDALEPDLSETYPKDYFTDEEAEFWAHLNYLHYAPEEDAYYATAREIDIVVRVDRATGETSWVLQPGPITTDAGDFLAESDIDYRGHSVEPTPDGILLFDTSSNLSEGCSAMSEFAIDTETWTVNHVWLYQPETCLVSGFLGNASTLSNGNRMMTLATNGQIDEVTADGELVWRMNTPTGYILGFAERLESLYPEE